MTEHYLTGLSRSRGAMLRRLPKGDKLIFEFDNTQFRLIHSAFVLSHLQVECLHDGNVVKSFELAPWRARIASCDKVIETVL